MGITQCNCERQYPEKVFVEMPIKYTEKEMKSAELILQSFKLFSVIKMMKEREEQTLTKINEILNKESKTPEIKTHLISFEKIFDYAKKFLAKCEIKKFDEIIFNQVDEKLDGIKSSIKEFYMKKIEEDKDFLSDLNAFIESKKKTTEQQNTTKEKDPLGLNFGNILKFLDKAKNFDLQEKLPSFNFASGLINKKVNFKAIQEISITKIEEEFDKLLDFMNTEQTSLLIEYYIQSGEKCDQLLRNLISNVFALKLMNERFLYNTNNKFVPVNKKKIKNILRRPSRDEEGLDRFETIRKTKNDKEDDEKEKEKEKDINLSNANDDKLYLRKTANPLENGNKSNINSNSVPFDKLKLVIQNIVREDEKEKEKDKDKEKEKDENLNVKKNQNALSRSILITPREEVKNNKLNLRALIKSTTLAVKEANNLKVASQFYNGELCKFNHLYFGYGRLYKNVKKYAYYGTFKMGRKNGIGKIFKKISENEYFYYGGEFTNNKYEGYGHSLLYLKQGPKKTIIIRDGIFSQNDFTHGQQIIIEDRENVEIIYEEYYGYLQNNVYSGRGSLKKRHLILNKINDNKYEAEYEYEYEGEFSNNLENGHGAAKKIFKLQNYSYRYEGEFLNGMMDGIGCIKYEGNYYIQSYEGVFEQDKTFCRYGRVKFKSGDEYEGFFENGKKAEVGIYFYKDKKNKRENFFGRFAEDNRDGIGRYNKPLENKVFVGKYIDGEKNGIFNLVYNTDSPSNMALKNKMSLSSMKKSNNFSNLKTTSFIQIIHESENNHLRGSTEIKTELFKQMKIYYLFENDEEIDKSDKPIKE